MAAGFRSQYNQPGSLRAAPPLDEAGQPVMLCGSDGKESACSVGDLGSIPGLGRSPRGVHGNPLQYSCLENPHRQRSLAGYTPWGRKESDTTERLSTHTHSQWFRSGYYITKLAGSQWFRSGYYITKLAGFNTFHLNLWWLLWSSFAPGH